MGRISLPLALLGVQALLGMVVDAQYNVYYGYTAQELQEFIADTVMAVLCFFPLSFSILLSQETGMVVEEMVYDGADCHCR